MTVEILLPSSKSISNRILIIRALSNGNATIHNLSEAGDTKDLLRCLESEESEIDVGEGATTMRFLLAYFAISQKKKTLHCGPSLQKRPLRKLLDSLVELGCEFKYLENEFQLPLQIRSGIQKNHSQHVFIDTSTSSQFVSAILLISPYLENSLIINFSNQVVSEPYIQMTIKLIKEFGVEINKGEQFLSIQPSPYLIRDYYIEADWSSASFFFALLGLLKKGIYFFPDLRLSGLQGDEILLIFFKQFGISTISESNGIKISFDKPVKPEIVVFDFTNYPDLFPAFAIFCAIQKTNAHFSGLQHLAFKESNRLMVINDFLIQQNISIQQNQNENGNLSAFYQMNTFNPDIPDTYSSHNDHRIAMAFSLLNTIRKIQILNPEVVDKSFPGYWKQLQKIISV